MTFPYTVVTAEIIHNYMDYLCPPKNVLNKEAIQRQTRIWLNINAHENKIQKHKEKHEETRGLLYWTDVKVPIIKALFKESQSELATKIPLKLRVGDEVKVYFNSYPCYVVIDENIGVIGDMEFTFIFEGCTAVDLVAKGFVQKPAKVHICPPFNMQHKKRIKQFIQKWEDIVLSTEWASQTWHAMFQALFYLKPIFLDPQPQNILTLPELSFPGFIPNQEQLCISQKVIAGTEPILNIEGPPGCGKSVTICAIIRLLTKKP
ncbi:MAG: hypothetical protein GY861_05135 [bacterium]|nr:hypothetical protein [bacterium]